MKRLFVVADTKLNTRLATDFPDKMAAKQIRDQLNTDYHGEEIPDHPRYQIHTGPDHWKNL